MMLISILMGTGMLLLMMLIQRKKYDVSVGKTFAVHIVVTIITIIGACVGSALGGLSIKGLRLYGILMFDTVALLFLCKVFKMEIGRLGDYLAAPIIAVCSIVKIPCMVIGCCYGTALFIDAAGRTVRFPSQIVEFSIWAILTIWLLWIEKKGKQKNLLWPIATIWFGVFRFLVDYMRGNPAERRLILLGFPAGRFWSLFVLLMGVVLLIYLFRKYRGRRPSIKEVFRCIVGLAVD